MNFIKPSIEICCFSVEDAIAAELGGAHRIEFCADPAMGGVTPSIGSIELVRKHISIECWVILRPRGGDFVYSDLEKEIMLKDLIHIRSAGVTGIVTGALSPKGTLDIKFLTNLSAYLGDLKWSFHKAYDQIISPQSALSELKRLGAKRVLTSGGAPTALEGIESIQQYLSLSNGEIEIQAVGGIRANNVIEILNKANVTAIHASLRDDTIPLSKFQSIDVNRVRSFVQTVQSIR